MRLILMGPPGAGKGTQAKKICKNLRIPHISTGDLFMKNIEKATPLGLQVQSMIHEGLLVPDHLVVGMVKERLQEADAKEGFLLDGFPRTLHQGEVLMALLEELAKPLDQVFFIDVPLENILTRMVGRRVCRKCGASYHERFHPPKMQGQCDLCGHALVERKDDGEASVKRRLRVYEEETKPLVGFFTKKGLIKVIDGEGSIDTVTEEILQTLAQKV